MTCFRVQKNQTIDASTLHEWRAGHLDRDDVFDPQVLLEIIFGGVKSDDLHLTNDTEEVFKDWKTRKVRFEPRLDINSGPYYLHKGLL